MKASSIRAKPTEAVLRSAKETPRLQITNLSPAGLYVSGLSPERSDVGPGRAALAAVASEPAAVDAVFPAAARSRSVSDAHAP